MNIHHMNTLVFNASSANVEYFAVIPNFFCIKEDLRHVLMVCVLHVLKLCRWSHCPYKFPCTCLTTLSFIDIHRIDRISQSLRRKFPRAPRAKEDKVDGSRLRRNHSLCFPIGSDRNFFPRILARKDYAHEVPTFE